MTHSRTPRIPPAYAVARQTPPVASSLAAGDFSFITDPHDLRTARKDVSLARLEWQEACKARRASEGPFRRYALMKARLMRVEANL